MKEEIKIKVEPHFAGDYRLEYDGKYVTLFGKNKNYDMSGLFGAPEGTYDEGVLVPIVAEKRKANPEIVCIDDEFITIRL